MRISNNTNLNILNSITKFNFCAGYTKLYTDFDGTYFPFSQESIVYHDNKSITKANQMYGAFKDFINVAKEKFSLLITTGRSALEMYGILNYFEENNVDFNKPKGYIFRDGLEEVDNINDESLDSVSDSHLLYLKDEIKNIIYGIDKNITIIEPDSNKWIKGRENKTLETLFEKLEPKLRQKYVSIVAENNGMMELAFSPDTDIKPYFETINEYFRENGIPADINLYNNDKCLYIPYQKDEFSDKYVFMPANTIFIRPRKDGVKTDKLNKPKEDVRKIIENSSNDLVIVAGDGSNDIEMLNPLNYIDLLGITFDKEKSVEELFEQKDVLSAIEKLPLISIITGENECMDSILKIKSLLDKIGIYKIFVAKNPSKDFLNKVKQGMLTYSDENSEYKYNLGYSLYKEILE